MFNKIINPINNQEYSIFSIEGKKLLKNLVKQFYGGVTEDEMKIYRYLKKLKLKHHDLACKYCDQLNRQKSKSNLDLKTKGLVNMKETCKDCAVPYCEIYKRGKSLKLKEHLLKKDKKICLKYITNAEKANKALNDDTSIEKLSDELAEINFNTFNV